MKIGKLTNQELERFVIGKLKIKRNEVIQGSGVGVDCAVLNLGGDYCTISTDPITAADKGAGKLAVHISANDIAASGAEPFALLVTILVPPDHTLQKLAVIMEDIASEAEKMNMDIVGGHTEVTNAVNKPVVSVTALGKTRRILQHTDIRPGDQLILTKECGIEGALVICSDYPEKCAAVLDEEDKSLLSRMEGMLSVVEEAKIASEAGAIAMHDITEGGVLGAAYEMAEAAGLGLSLNVKGIPVNKVCQKVCRQFGLNPYRLISSGSMLIAARGETVLSALKAAGIEANAIGIFTEKGIKDEEGKSIEAPSQDELFKLR